MLSILLVYFSSNCQNEYSNCIVVQSVVASKIPFTPCSIKHLQLQKAMKLKLCSLLIGVFTVQFSVSLCDQELAGFCPDFTATFVTLSDQTLDDPNILSSDPEQTLFKEIMGFNNDDVQYVFEDAIVFFNETYGLDFSNSPSYEENEYFFESAKLSLFRFHEDVHFQLVVNNWIHTGNTVFTCCDVQDGGFLVTFSGDQLLHGSYGGDDGQPVGVGNFMIYGFSRFDVCAQSPVIIRIQSGTPFRQEPVDGQIFLNFDLYNNALGSGKALGSFSVKPDRDIPGKFRLVTRVVYTFPNN